MNHPHFAGQVVADHQADLIEQARRHRLLRTTTDDHPRAARLRPWARTKRGVSTEKRRSPLPLFSLLLSATALTVAVVAIATDQAGSRPAPTVVTSRAGNPPAVAPDNARPADEDITDADQPLQDNPYQPRDPHTDTPGGDCTARRLVVRC